MGSIVADATDQTGAVQQVFIADDDDGNLANGTPHMQDLIWACQQHSLPHPGPSTGILNDECTYPTLLQNGVTGPLSTVGATSSMVNWGCSAAGNDLWYYYQASDAGTLTVERVWTEPGVAWTGLRAAKLEAELARFARLANVTDIIWMDGANMDIRGR